MDMNTVEHLTSEVRMKVEEIHRLLGLNDGLEKQVNQLNEKFTTIKALLKTLLDSIN